MLLTRSHLRLVQTLLRQLELRLLGGELRQLLPLLLAGGLPRQRVARVQVTQLDGEVKLVLGI